MIRRIHDNIYALIIYRTRTLAGRPSVAPLIRGLISINKITTLQQGECDFLAGNALAIYIEFRVN